MATTSNQGKEKVDLRSKAGVTIREIELDAALGLLDTWEALGLKMPRAVVTYTIAAELVGANVEAANKLVEDSYAEREKQILGWLKAQRKLWPAIIGAVTDLSTEEIGKLTLTDVAKIFTVAVKLVDRAQLLDFMAAFFSVVGDLTEGVAKLAPNLPGTAGAGAE